MSSASQSTYLSFLSVEMRESIDGSSVFTKSRGDSWGGATSCNHAPVPPKLREQGVICTVKVAQNQISIYPHFISYYDLARWRAPVQCISDCMSNYNSRENHTSGRVKSQSSYEENRFSVIKARKSE